MIEKMIKILEEEIAWYETHGCNKTLKRGIIGATRKAISVISEVAKKYGNASDNDLTVVSALPSLYPLQPFEEEAIHRVVASAKEYAESSVVKENLTTEKDGGWIPVEERLPSKEEFFQNDGRFIVTDGNRVYQSTYDIYGQCFRTMKMHVLIDMGYQSSFEVDNCVIEWMPLPPYQKGEQKKAFNEEKCRTARHFAACADSYCSDNCNMQCPHKKGE